MVEQTETAVAGSNVAETRDPTPLEQSGQRGPRLSEDWAATIAGLLLLALALGGVITRGMVP